MGNYGLLILVLLAILGKYNVEANSFEPQLVENGQNVLKVKQEDYVYGWWGYNYYHYYNSYYNTGIYCYRYGYYYSYGRYHNKRWRCTRITYKYKCMLGYRSHGLNHCPYAICAGQTNPTGACNQHEQVSTKFGMQWKYSQGSCISPENCHNCSIYYYNNGPRCTACPKIAHCLEMHCFDTAASTICANCEGVVRDAPYYRAYVRSDDKKQCLQACSWRSDSTRCYPGYCDGELAANCRCVQGFTGKHCEIMTEHANIVSNWFNLRHKHYVLNNPSGTVDAGPHPIIWSNYGGWDLAETVWNAQYVIKERLHTNSSHYIKEFVYGIIKAGTVLNFTQNVMVPVITYFNTTDLANETMNSNLTFGADNTSIGVNNTSSMDFNVTWVPKTIEIIEKYHCPKVSKLKPATSSFECRKNFSLESGSEPLNFSTGDTMTFTIEADIGGFLIMEHRENHVNETHNLIGTTKTLEYVFRWDFVLPYHCVEKETNTENCVDPLTVQDLTEQSTISITWGDWFDDLAGLQEYKYQIHAVSNRNNILKEDGPLKDGGEGTIHLNETFKELNLPGTGLYSIHLTAYDKAGNYKSTRRFVLFDSNSHVSHNPYEHSRVDTGSENTNYTWVVDNTTTIEVTWKKRFRNALHDHNKWLNEISESHGIAEAYDDYTGIRNVTHIKNVYGCVDFRVEYFVYDGTGVKDHQPSTPVQDISTESEFLRLNWWDGDKAVITVIAVDIFSKTLNDTLTVYRDASPPVIENLWLTRGERLNISVHRLEDFTEMTIEWVAYDYHSGIDSIYWRLYDNFTGESILHGHEDLFAQGSSQDINECKLKYGNYSRGPNCYQTNHWGAFHRHYQIKPEVKRDGGLVHGKDVGLHDSDYFLKVNATNKALLSTILTKKITIDISPPHTGTVQDGIRGTDEIDFQQSKTLNAYWDGFFDKESGVMFYMYGFDTKPIPSSEFQLDSISSIVKETYSLEASHTVTSEGTYYACVVAYNRALEPSDPVCSDGVTVTTDVPYVTEVDISNAHVREGLVTDVGRTNYWVISTNRRRRLIHNPTTDCVNKAVSVSNVEMFPIEYHANRSTVRVNGSLVCANTSATSLVTSPMISKSSNIKLSWSSNETLIHDYEVGLSTLSGSTAPDIMTFRSSKQHCHINLMHTDLPEGKPFYFIIKTISKSNIIGIQSIGPCFIDTTPPTFFPSISVSHDNGHLVVSWNVGSFNDPDDPFPLHLKVAVGHSPRGTQVLKYSPLKAGASCSITEPPTCTTIPISDTEWGLHGNHTYYVTVKAENAAGLISYGVSDPYIHNVQLPSTGIVMDVPSSTGSFFIDIADIDFTSTNHSLSARWTGFYHAYIDVTYRFRAGTSPGASDTVPDKDVGTNESYTENGLSLIAFKTYYVTIIAESAAGSVNVTSDGVTVVQENAILNNVTVYDGEPCVEADMNISARFDHHDWNIQRNCTTDVDFQTSTDTLSAYWEIPVELLPFTPDVYFSVEKKSFYGDDWSLFQDYRYNHGHHQAHVTGLLLDPGRLYRFVVKLCARETCYQPVHSNGVLVLANPPVTNTIHVNHDNTTTSEKLQVVLDMFADPDLQIPEEKYGVVDKYEWAITDQSEIGRLHTRWHRLDDYDVIPHKYQMEFIISLDGSFDFSKCRKLTVRGYNKAGLYSTVSSEIKSCSAFDPVLIKPNIVIDAVGTPDPSRDGYGEAILLQTNARWPHPDKDYTPNMNYISAVWPTLRYNSYTVAVIIARNMDATSYYLPSTTLSLSDPCSHPDAVKCDTTEHEFINVKFKEGELQHGHRYIVCIHTEYTEIQHEKWTQVLPEINSCSDGIVVDLTPPTAGNVWIGTQGQRYQISTTGMFISWGSFEDVEEFQTISHSSGIQNYMLGIGTSVGGNDVVAFLDVGVVNHKAIHGLTLHGGHTYYATVKATDFSNRTTVQTSGSVTVDTSPPIKFDKPITLPGRHITSTAEIEACWKDVFRDPESGIDFFMWSIGSQPGHSDIMEFTKESSECGINNKNQRLDIKEGHAYYITVKAYNKARLMTIATSWAYIVDFSPPIQGQVFDVLPSGDGSTDIDYQTDMSRIRVVWSGFHDPHSVIKEYFVRIGTCPFCDDVLRQQDIGLVNEIEVDYVHIGPGLTYFTTVSACNTADMCTSAISDGVIFDNSPPNVGLVIDGTSSEDVEYQSIRNWIGAKWYGFSDPQSGISHYIWWAGTTPGGNDILQEKEVHLVETATAYNFSQQLPESKRIYVTVRAYNKAGLYSDAISSGFLVDTTPPLISSGPKFTRDFGLVADTQFYRSSVKVEWKVADPETHIERQYLSLKSHHGGDFQHSSTQINGIARDYILNDLTLHDGVRYYVTLVSCNGAQICSSSTSTGVLVDSTPPSRGTFAIQTDHSVDKELERHVSGFMTWWKYAVNIAWLGFADAHCDIMNYFVNIGSAYMGADLNAEEGIPKTINHSNNGKDCYDEGKVQTYRIPTQKLVGYDYLYISVWAVNQVGLSSAIIHSKFKKLPQGILSLVRRCDSEDCEGQCVCSPQDKVCHNNGSTCNDVTIGNPNNLLQVSDVMFGSPDIHYSPSNTVLQGRWTIVHRQGSKPYMYQWSVGLTAHDVPVGIFDPEHDRVWHDAGQLNFVVFTTTPGQDLEETVSFSVFVKAWYNRNTYAVFKSSGVIVDTKKPAVQDILGSSISERMIISTMKDDDYTREGISMMVNWTNKFSKDKTTIKSYRVYISTSPEGHDVWDSGEDLPNTETTYLVRSVSLVPGVRYFVNVIAYGFSGIHHTESSDGFVIDNTRPKAGVVFDGIGLHDREYQNSSKIVGAHWHGFLDMESGVKNYFWCVGNTSSKSECSIRNWENVGIHTSVSRMLSQTLVNGQTCYNKVYAVDNVGYKSDIVLSDGVKVDVTPPEPEYLFHIDNNLLKNPSFELHQSSLPINDTSLYDICSLTPDFFPDHWSLTSGSCVTAVSSMMNLARDGRSFLFIRGSVKQEIKGIKLGGLYRVYFYSSHPPVMAAFVSNKEGFISVSESKHVFLLYSKAYRHDEHKLSYTREIVSWQKHTFYFKATQENMILEIGSADSKTGLFLDYLSLQNVERIRNNSAESQVSAHVVYIHQWGSIHGAWSFFEDNSPITEYNWAIGYTEGGTQIQQFTSTGVQNFGYNYNVTLIHNTLVHVTVIASNAAELVGISYSKPVLVDLTPPEIVYVYDGRLSTTDENAWTDNEVVMNFMVKDEESGIDYCEWAIGYQPQGIDLQTFYRLGAGEYLASKDFDYSVLESKTIYSTVRCHNRAGLFSSKSSDGVKISVLPPSITNAKVTAIPLSITEYKAGFHYQSNVNNVRIQWFGFEDYTGIEQFKISFHGHRSTFKEKMTFPVVQDIQSVDIVNMNMPEGLKNITIQAISKLLLASDKVIYNLTAVHSKPTKKGSTLVHSWHTGNEEFTVSWEDVFISQYPLFYEVTVGTVEGGSDILQWQETKLTSVKFRLPPTIKKSSVVSLHVNVRAISAGGTFEDIKFVIIH
ncbi:uncharacterized protein LOC128183063 isoform X2 [Crassostrea angulata]|uniref:uncharacterized protein LOC128183063 isoform X2 n=1 Tax=Magallana angulata TaxID=2784310 RepID=UPI0022B0CDF4|nr:uncharacterized protein LOC128183063 isoform X2 [Crassostrea angulata]